jgi:hypothetical protein
MPGTNMEPKAQETLASALQHVREMKTQRVADLRPYQAFAAGVIAGLEDSGILTGLEAGEWKKKLDDIGTEPSKRVRRRPRSKSSPPRPDLGFVKLVPGPRDPEAFLDGYMRIVAVELLNDRVRVHWNLHPLPSHFALLGDDLRKLDEDTEGLAEEDREHQRFIARSHRLHRLMQFTASDNVGTKYRHSRGGSSGSMERSEESGISDFQPAAPNDATSFVVRVYDAKFTISLI